MEYKFNFENKEQVLNEEGFLEIINDEENPIEDLSIELIFDLLNNANKELVFERAYYEDCCSECNYKKGEEKVYPFLECQFYLNTKDNKFVTSNISEENQGLTFGKMKRLGKVDSSYIAFIDICENCKKYFVAVEKVEE